MHTHARYTSVIVSAAFVIVAALGIADVRPSHAQTQQGESERSAGKIVVANRAAGTISVIDAERARLIRNIALPAASRPPEPMYVVNTTSFGGDRIWVGDRANNRVVVFDSDSFDVVDNIPTGAGVFHMWADPHGRQLWVVNDVDRTATVVDIRTMSVAATVHMPADLVAAGARPHDVVLDEHGRSAYVTVTGSGLSSDMIVRFDTSSFRERARAAVGRDPHVSYNRKTDQIFSPNQLTNNVYVLDGDDLSVADVIAIPAAHGAATSHNAHWFFATNISGGGTNAVYAIDTRTRSIAAVASTAFPTPHNLALTPNGKMLYVTHSGATNDRVSVMEVDSHGQMRLVGDIVTGANPFGLAYVR